MRSRSYKERLVEAMFESDAVIIDPYNPYRLRGGYLSPMYVENSMLLQVPEYRSLVARNFRKLIRDNRLRYDVIAGLTTAPVSFATTLADELEAPLIYADPKTCKIGGVSRDRNIQNKKVILVEDSVTTGGSACNGVRAIRNAGGLIDHCLAIVTYDLDEARENFSGLSCELHALLTSGDIITRAIHIPKDARREVYEWHKNPVTWTEKHVK